jgi:hypothetical protein
MGTLSWGKFCLTVHRGQPVLRDSDGLLWSARFRHSTPLLLNWFMVTAFFRKTAADSRARHVRRRSVAAEALDNEVLGWLRRTLDLGHKLESARHFELGDQLIEIAARVEYLRWKGHFRLDGRGDYGLADCWPNIPADRAKRFALYGDSVLWAFNRFRSACNAISGRRSSLQGDLDFLFRDVAVGVADHLFTDVDALERRIYRIDSRIRADKMAILMEAVLMLVTRNGPVGQDGKWRT